MLQEDLRYYEAFKKSKLYIKLLAELDLLQDATITKPADSTADIYQNGVTLFFLQIVLLSFCVNTVFSWIWVCGNF